MLPFFNSKARESEIVGVRVRAELTARYMRLNKMEKNCVGLHCTLRGVLLNCAGCPQWRYPSLRDFIGPSHPDAL